MLCFTRRPKSSQETNFGRFFVDFGWIFGRFWVDFELIFGSSSYSKRLKLAKNMFYNFGIWIDFWMFFGCFWVHFWFIFQSTSVVISRGAAGYRQRRRRSGRAPNPFGALRLCQRDNGMRSMHSDVKVPISERKMVEIISSKGGRPCRATVFVGL